MRRILISLLLAGAAATPAMAGPHNWSNNNQAQEDRQQAREERQQARVERQQSREDARSERSNNRPSYNPQQFNGQNGPQYVRPQFNGSGGGQPQQQFDARSRHDGQAVQQDYYRGQREQNLQDMRQRFDQRRDERELRQSQRVNPNVMHDRHPLVVSDTPRPGTQPPLRADSYHHNGNWNHNWNQNWRNDHRYDWRHYRNRHRSLFHLGFYIDPFGWGYQPFQIGWRLWPNYYGNQYWIDPSMYSLPYPPPGTTWVRYWNDALLVDLYSGTVIDVIPGFFW
jgi:Ni/Co efflux regulator RcnB